MSDFIIMKKFKVDIHPPRAPVTKEIIWSPLLLPIGSKGIKI
jgi:hypothetical protein